MVVFCTVSGLRDLRRSSQGAGYIKDKLPSEQQRWRTSKIPFGLLHIHGFVALFYYIKETFSINLCRNSAEVTKFYCYTAFSLGEF